jgi:UDP-N-acetylmuramyl tripeptide synthase
MPVERSTFFPLPGTYNKYNTLAAVLAAQTVGVSQKTIDTALQKVTPAFGRQEELEYKGKKIQIFLSKNPTSMNESLRTIMELASTSVILNPERSRMGEESHSKNKESSISKKRSFVTTQDDMTKPTVLFVLNDRIPDGRDVSWIWDIDMEEYVSKFGKIFLAGDRSFDMGLRVSYSMQFPISNFQFPIDDPNSNVQVYENLKEAINSAVGSLDANATLYILPTYSAMLEVRKILTGRKIL